MDFSTKVTIVNEGIAGTDGPSDLMLKSSASFYGEFTQYPPSIIGEGESFTFEIKDLIGMAGSEGQVEYLYVDKKGRPQSVTFRFGCPTTSDNLATCNNPKFAVYAKSGDGTSWGKKSEVPANGHPLHVAYVWGQGPAPK